MPRGEVERFRKGRFATNDGLIAFGLAILGPYYPTYDVTRADLALAREFDLIASMHVGGGSRTSADGFERLLDEDWSTTNSRSSTATTFAQTQCAGSPTTAERSRSRPRSSCRWATATR